MPPAAPHLPLRLFVGLTAIPARMAGLEARLEALLNQTEPPERIFLSIPRRYRRFDTPDPLPIDLARFGDRVVLIRCKTDDGPGTKLLGCLDHLPRGPNVRLVLVDDDLVYKPHMLAAFAAHHTAHPRQAASFHVYRYRGLRVGQGADGFSIPADALGGIREFHATLERSRFAFFVDDLWISYFLHRQGIAIDDLTRSTGQAGTIYTAETDAEALSKQQGLFTRRRAMSRTRWFLRLRHGPGTGLRRIGRLLLGPP